MPKPRVLATLAMDAAGDHLLEGIADIVVAPDSGAQTLYAMIGDADVLVVRTHLPADLFDRPNRLIGVVRHGTGLDLIPVDAATAQAIPVANVPGVNAEAVAEYCLASFLALVRPLHWMDRDLRIAGWKEGRAHSAGATELFGRTVGIVGLGSIGVRLAEICRVGFGMRVIGYQRRLDAMPGYVERADLDTLFRESDFISLNCPLTPETRHLVDARRLALMKPSAVIVNAARGPVIDEAALADALARRAIAGAAVDVFDTQPLARDHPFLALDNILLTPHAAGLTQESNRRMSEGTAHEVLRLLRGERPVNLVNPEIWDQAVARRQRLSSQGRAA
ncbi:MAG: hydroxyacid dehydrogenase [Pseudomonadota bacterium]|nr:hydroxyacid dehydrogenase [Pseudomonadota bacterium]